MGEIVRAICGVAISVVLACTASATELAYDFNEGGVCKAVNLGKPGVCILTPTGYEASRHPPRVKSGAKVRDAGQAAHFLGRLFDATPWPDKDGENTYRYVTSSAGVDYSADGNAGTVAAWIRLDDGDDGRHPHIGYPLRIITWDEPASGGIRHLFGIRNGYLRFNDYYDPPGAGSDQYQSTVTAFGEGETGWHHVAVTWQDGVGSTFYLDGRSLGDRLPGKQAGGAFVKTNLSLRSLAVGNSPNPNSHGIWNGTVNGDLDEIYLNLCSNRGPSFDPHHPEHGGFSLTKTQDATPRPAYYTMQRICGLFSDGVKPTEKPLKIEIPLDRTLGRKGLAWTRPYAGHPRHWEGAVPLRQPTTPRKYAFTTPQGELMIAVWMPVHAEDER